MWKPSLLVSLLVASVLGGCTSAVGSCDAPEDHANPIAVIETNLGTFCAELFAARAPITVDNFVRLADSDYYDGTISHRIITEFMMQAGDPTGTGRGGESADGGTIPDEFHPELRHDKAGILSMANAGANTGGSQFFVTFTATPWLDDKHSVFGQVIDGMDVVNKIEAEAATRDGTPRTNVDIRSISILPGSGDYPEPPAPDVRVGVVQADAWAVSGTTDHLAVYAENFGGATDTLTWNAVQADGTALPDGITITFDPVTTVLATGRGGDDPRPSTVHAVATIEVTGSFPDLDLMIKLGDESVEVPIHAGPSGTPFGPGDEVRVTYRGTFDDGAEFDSGEFGTVLGSGQTVPGFDYGLMGLVPGEEGRLDIPAGLGYGYDASGRLAQFKGETLHFDVTLA